MLHFLRGVSFVQRVLGRIPLCYGAVPQARAEAPSLGAPLPRAKARCYSGTGQTGVLSTIRNFALRTRIAHVAVLLAVALPSAWAKDLPITGVLLYPTASGYGYVQVTGCLVNGKTELRACSGNGLVDKSAYKSMAKINLATVKTLERMPDGTLVADVGSGAAICVVPGNFKFERDAAMKAADLVDKSAYGGQVLGSNPVGVTVLPALAPGAKFIFGTATDVELAEYLMAERSRTIPAWGAYLGKFTNGAHAGQARAGEVVLLVRDGSAKLAAYAKTAGLAAPEYDDLKAARERADQALDLVASDAAAMALRESVRQQMKLIADNAAAKLQVFKDAMAAHKQGYPLLVSAKDLSGRVVGVDPKYAPGVTVQNNVANETRALDAAIQAANAQRTAQKYDAAYASVVKYVSFSAEEPRLGEIVRDDYKFHMDKADAEVLQGNWEGAVADVKRAREITPTDEAKVALEKAEAGLLTADNKAAAEKAQARSKTYMDDQDPIGAYEVFANLTPAQQLLVKDDMTALEAGYVTATTRKAKDEQAAHTPIHGIADENAIRQAHDYLQRASKLSDDPDIGIKLDAVADEISAYYVDLGGKYLERPLSSGVGVGWSYLTEAQQYRPNLDAVRDARTRNGAAYQMRSKLSIGVVFRDQTSRRVSAGFADQLQQAFATGLETSGLPVKVVLPGAAAGAIEPNFQFVGEILEHRTIRDPKKETLQSEYRSGSREIPNPEWNKADQAYEGANLDLERAQSALTGATAKNNKKMIEEANRNVDRIQATVQAERAKMNALPKTMTDDVVSSYNYTRTTLELKNVVDLSFRVLDASGALIGGPIHVVKDDPKTFVILENINPDDTKGLKEIDSPPDEDQLMNDVEIAARDSMVKAALEQVRALPQKILAQARAKAASTDLDGAAELYVLYLNCTPAKESPERGEAERFLLANFNLRHAGELSAAVQ